MESKKIGVFLKKLRNEKGLTQEQLAEVFQVSGRTVSRWETGRNLPELSILIQISEYYDVDIKDILEGEKESENMDKELKETLDKIADYNSLEKKIVARANKIAFLLIFGICTIAIVIQLLLIQDLKLVFGESIAMIVGGATYIGIMVHNGTWNLDTPWKNTWKHDLLISVVCGIIFGIAYALTLSRISAAYVTIAKWAVCFVIGITVFGFVVLRVMAYTSAKRRQLRENSFKH